MLNSTFYKKFDQLISCLGVCECDLFKLPWQDNSCVVLNYKCWIDITFDDFPEEKCKKMSCLPSGTIDLAGIFSSRCRNCIANQVEKVCDEGIYCHPEFKEKFFEALDIPLATVNFHASILGIPFGNSKHEAGNGTDRKPKKACPKTTSPGMHSSVAHICRLPYKTPSLHFCSIYLI